MESLQGLLLVASPELADPNFRKTVVLIVRHSADEGTLGLVLNRHTSTSVRELWQRMGQENCKRDTPLSLGGPCEGPLMALHTDAQVAELEVLPGLYFTASSDQLRALVDEDENAGPARFFFGYAGWAAGQLEMELQAGAGAPSRPACGMSLRCIPNCGNARSAKPPAGKCWRRYASRECRSIPREIECSSHAAPRHGLLRDREHGSTRFRPTSHESENGHADRDQQQSDAAFHRRRPKHAAQHQHVRADEDGRQVWIPPGPIRARAPSGENGAARTPPAPSPDRTAPRQRCSNRSIRRTNACADRGSNRRPESASWPMPIARQWRWRACRSADRRAVKD